MRVGCLLDNGATRVVAVDPGKVEVVDKRLTHFQAKVEDVDQ